MLPLKCACGASHDVPESFVGEHALCLQCGHALHVVAGGAVAPPPQSRVGARLQVLAGPARVGEQFFPVGPAPVEIGKLPQNAICLAGSKVSRNHCQLVRRGSTWRIEDLHSTNGLLVNDRRVRASTLRYGDVIQVGDFRLRFDTLSSEEEEEEVIELTDDDLADVSPDELVDIEDVEEDDGDGFGAYDLKGPPPPPAFVPAAVATPAAVAVIPLPAIPIDGPPCPCCEKTLPRNAKVCVECGIRVPSGRPLIISRGMDEDDAEKQNQWIDVISWIVPINLIPIGSEAFGAHKARAVWYVTAITVLVSLWFLVVNIGAHGQNFANLELWAGSSEATQQILANAPDNDDDFEALPRAQQIAIARAIRVKELGSDADFHPYQLLTNALLHGGILHLAGNLVFLIVFGKRVNEAIGDLAMGIVYPLLAISASAIYLLAMSSAPRHAALGASGAIMGLAGMYFVFFPVQRVHLAFWIRLRFLFVKYRKVFRPRGFWLLVVWVLWNDVLPVLLGTQTDGVGHWAHLGGFLTGMAFAIILLVSRLGDSMGGDLLSVCLGKHAWPLIGKPNRWLGEVVPDMTPRPRRILANR